MFVNPELPVDEKNEPDQSIFLNPAVVLFGVALALLGCGGADTGPVESVLECRPTTSGACVLEVESAAGGECPDDLYRHTMNRYNRTFVVCNDDPAKNVIDVAHAIDEVYGPFVPQPPPPPLPPAPSGDVILLLDTHASMCEEGRILGGRAERWISEFAASRSWEGDYRVAVLPIRDLRDDNFACFVSAEEAVADLSCASDTAPTECSGLQGSVLFDAPVEEQVRQLGCMLRLPYTRDTPPSGLEALRRALSPEAAARCPLNAGFLRPEAALQIMIYSDDNDCSHRGSQPYPDREACEAANLTPVSDYVDFVQSLKSSPEHIDITLTTGPPSEGYQWGGDLEPSCGGQVTGSAYDGYRYREFVAAFGGSSSSICEMSVR